MVMDDYSKQAKSDINLKKGRTVDVIEKRECGKCNKTKGPDTRCNIAYNIARNISCSTWQHSCNISCITPNIWLAVQQKKNSRAAASP